MAERQLLRCSKCGQDKTEAEMARTKQRASGLSSWCRACKNAVNKAWYERNRMAIADQQSEYHRANRVGRLEQMRAYRERPENRARQSTAIRRRHLRKTYGLTEAEYRERLARQGGVCAICAKPESAVDARTGNVRHLAVDHDHQTGRVRGLLCFRCNTVLAHIDMDRERLLGMVRYLDAEGAD